MDSGLALDPWRQDLVNVKNSKLHEFAKGKKIELPGTLTLSLCFKSNLYSQVWSLSFSPQLKKYPTNLLPPPPADNFDLSLSLKIQYIYFIDSLQLREYSPKKKQKKNPCFSSHISIAGPLPTLWVLTCMWRRQKTTHQDISKTDYFMAKKMEFCEEVGFGTDFNNCHPQSTSF